MNNFIPSTKDLISALRPQAFTAPQKALARDNIGFDDALDDWVVTWDSIKNGALPVDRLPSLVARRDQANTFSQAQTFNDSITIAGGNSAVVLNARSVGAAAVLYNEGNNFRIFANGLDRFRVNLVDGKTMFAKNTWHQDDNLADRLYYSGGGGTFLRGYGSDPFIFRNGSDTTVASINSAGQINTTGDLVLRKNVASGFGAQIYLGDENFVGGFDKAGPGFAAVYRSTGAPAGDLAAYVYSGPTTRSEVWRCFSSGNMAIGSTTDNVARVQIANNGLAPQLRLSPSGANPWDLYAAYSTTNSDLLFLMNGSTKVSFDANGLITANAATFNGIVSVGNSLTLRDTGTGNARIAITETGAIDCGGNLLFRNADGSVVRASIDSSGNTTFNGSLNLISPVISSNQWWGFDISPGTTLNDSITLNSRNTGCNFVFRRSGQFSAASLRVADGPMLKASGDLSAMQLRNGIDSLWSNFEAGGATFNGPLIANGTPTSPGVYVGSLELQSYAINNCWIGDNVYYGPSGWRRRNTGATGLFYFAGAEGQFRFTAGGAANTDPGSPCQLKIRSTGDFAVGPDVGNAPSDLSGAVFRVFPSGDVTANGHLTITGNARLEQLAAKSMALRTFETSLSAWQEPWRGQASASGATIGFLGATPIVRQTLPAAATDAATTQTLANALRSLAINFGLAN